MATRPRKLTKSVHSDGQSTFSELMIGARKSAHLTQHELAKRHLKLSAIAATDETISTGPHTTYTRLEGTALHEDRMSLADLEKVREQVGSDTWEAQYQQEPVPPGGSMVKRTWVARYEMLPERKFGSQIIQSVDTAIKAGPLNDYSVITTWLFQDYCYWLVEVARKRLEYPALTLLWHFRLSAVCKDHVTVGTSSGWRSCEEVEDRLPDGWHAWLWWRS